MCRLFGKYLIFYFIPKTQSNLNNTFKPIYILLSVFGLFPYSIKCDKSKRYFSIIPKSLYINALCSISMVLAFVSFFAVHLQDIMANSDNTLTDTIVTQLNYLVELVNLHITCIVCYIYAFINRKNYVEMLNTVSMTVHKLSPIEFNIFAKLRSRIYISVIGGLFWLTIAHIAINFTRDDGWWKVTMVTFSFDLPQIVQFVYIAHIYVMIQLVITLLSKIRENIHKLVKEKQGFIDGFSNLDDTTAKLRNMQMAYAKAFELTKMINATFQTPILLTTVACFHSMVSEAHIIYHGTVIERSLTTHNIINCLTWLLWQVLKIYILGDTGNRLKLQAQKIGQSLHNVPIIMGKSNFGLLLEIQHFSSQITFQMTELTVFGYFPLDSTLLYNIVASATMYLIILVQFDRRE